MIWGMFMAAMMNECGDTHGKEFPTVQSFVKNCEGLTLKLMFDVTAQSMNDQEEIHGLDKIQWEKDSWERLSLIGDETVINLQSTKVNVFSDSDFPCNLGQTPAPFTRRILFMSMFNDISCDRKSNKDECLANAGVVKVLVRNFGVGQWSFLGPGSEKKWYSAENSPQGAWDNIAEEMLLEFAESGHPTFRATTPLSRGQLKSKGRGKLSLHFAADDFTIDTIFRIILSVSQLSIYGAVAALCEEFENHQDGSGEPEILMGQSIVLGEIKAEIPLEKEDSMNEQIVWQQYIQQVESLSPESKVSRFCKGTRFLRVVEVGQYFVTKDTGNLRQFRSVACREYTLPRDDPASEAKGWIQGHMRIGLYEKSRPIIDISNVELKLECFLWVKTILNLWSECPVEQPNTLLNQFKTTQKFLWIHKKSKCHKRASRLLRPDQGQKQNHNREYSLVQQQPYQYMKEDRLTLSHQTKSCLIRFFDESDQSSST